MNLVIYPFLCLGVSESGCSWERPGCSAGGSLWEGGCGWQPSGFVKIFSTGPGRQNSWNMSQNIVSLYSGCVSTWGFVCVCPLHVPFSKRSLLWSWGGVCCVGLLEFNSSRFSLTNPTLRPKPKNSQHRLSSFHPTVLLYV